jgi:hypothetical protein
MGWIDDVKTTIRLSPELEGQLQRAAAIRGESLPESTRWGVAGQAGPQHRKGIRHHSRCTQSFQVTLTDAGPLVALQEVTSDKTSYGNWRSAAGWRLSNYPNLYGSAVPLRCGETPLLASQVLVASNNGLQAEIETVGTSHQGVERDTAYVTASESLNLTLLTHDQRLAPAPELRCSVRAP